MCYISKVSLWSIFRIPIRAAHAVQRSKRLPLTPLRCVRGSEKTTQPRSPREHPPRSSCVSRPRCCLGPLLYRCPRLRRRLSRSPPTGRPGVAVQVITPDQPMWMAGYGSRNKPAEGKLTELYVKALALEDPHGGRLVLLTSDLVGIPRSLSEAVAVEVKKRKGLPRERLMLTVSHTHCGPVLNDSLRTMYDMPAEEAKKIEPYTAKVKDWMIDAIVRALDDLKPARVAFGKGTARFAVNRRKPTPKGVDERRQPGRAGRS